MYIWGTKKLNDMEETYDNLPDWIKEELFKIHSHNGKEEIIYKEDDIIKVIWSILKNY